MSRRKFVHAARHFIEDSGLTLLFWRREFWTYTGTHYEKFDEGNPETMRLYIDKWHIENDAKTTMPIDNHSVHEIEARVKSLTFLATNQRVPGFKGTTAPARQQPDDILTMRNGILDLRPCLRGEAPVLSAHTADWISTACLPYDYDPDAKCPQWLAFLDTVLQKDTQRINLLQEWFGYCCTYDTSHEKAMIFEGTGGNGKSQAIAVLESLVGRSNCSAVPLQNLGQRFQAFGTLGKLVNLCTETDEGAQVPLATLKNLITGDDFQYERKGVDSFSAKPTAKFVFSMNNRPHISDNTNAIWRRLLVMPWTYEVPASERVLDLGRKIADTELSGIFNWAVAGLRRLRRQGDFTQATAVVRAVESYRSTGDPVRAVLTTFVEDGDDTAFISRADVWAKLYTQAAEINAELPSGYSLTRFATDVTRIFPRAVDTRRRTDKGQVRGWLRIKFKEKDANVAAQNK